MDPRNSKPQLPSKPNYNETEDAIANEETTEIKVTLTEASWDWPNIEQAEETAEENAEEEIESKTEEKAPNDKGKGKEVAEESERNDKVIALYDPSFEEEELGSTNENPKNPSLTNEEAETATARLIAELRLGEETQIQQSRELLNQEAQRARDQQKEDDYRIAVHLSIHGHMPADAPKAPPVSAPAAPAAESSATAAARPLTTTSKHTCVVCQEDFSYMEVARAPCDHEYCRACLKDLFWHSLKDEQSFPPTCCKIPIGVASIGILLPKYLVLLFRQKEEELSTPNRTYCSNPQCSQFIRKPDIKNDRGTCSKCGTATCIICKHKAHTGDCPEDTALQQALQIAKQKGWKRCYQCGRLVERIDGCNHMRVSEKMAYSDTSLLIFLVRLSVRLLLFLRCSMENL
jgi:hypothetical protein